MPYFFGAAQQGYQDAMNQIAAKQQRDQALQMQALQMKAMQQQIDRENQQQQLMKQAAEWQAQQGMQPQQTVPPGQPSQPMQQPIQPAPWQAVPSAAPQQTPAIPPVPTRKQTQVNDYGIPPELMQAQDTLQNKAMQLSSSPDNPQVLYERLRQSGNPNWLAIYKQLEPEAVKRFSAQKQMFDVEKGMFDEQVKVWQDQNRARSEALRDKKLTAAITAAMADKKEIPQETIDYYAKQSLSGDNSWQVGLARGKVGQKLISAVKDRIPQMAKEMGMSPQEASAMKGQRDATVAALKDRQKFVATGTQFVNNFQKQADLVEKYMKAGAAGQSPVINRWIQAGRKAVAGDPDVAAFDTAIRGLAREHQRIVTGVTSNAQLHVSAQETADELLNRNMTPSQIKATLKVMREEAKNAVDSGKEELGVLTTQLKSIGKPAEKVSDEDLIKKYLK